MPLTKEQQELVARIRADHPSLSRNITNDEDFYRGLQAQFPKSGLTAPVGAPQAPRAPDKQRFSNPNKIQEDGSTFMEWATKTLIPEEWIQKSDYLQGASTKSTGGAMWEAFYGGSQYDVPEDAEEEVKEAF